MLLQQTFKTAEGARKRAAFETNHCNGKYLYVVVRCLNNLPDCDQFEAKKFNQYTWRIERKVRS
jgi:hypothetical protein